ARDVEDRARAAGRQHDRAQAVAVHADHHADARRDSSRHRSAGSAQRNLRRRRVGIVDDESSDPEKNFLHRLSRDRQEGCRSRRTGSERVTLELGGNDAAIVLSDVDLASVAPKIFWGAMENSGQICSAIKRVYVPQEMYAPMLEMLGELAKGVKVGNGLEAGTQMGPINNRPQFERVTELVEDAKKHGAKIISGGAVGKEGYFFAPTIVGNLSDGVRLVDEEQFGPALPIIPYKDVADAFKRASATHYGLSGSVWSKDSD